MTKKQKKMLTRILVCAVMLIALSFVDNAQLHHISDVAAIDDPACALPAGGAARNNNEKRTYR